MRLILEEALPSEDSILAGDIHRCDYFGARDVAGRDSWYPLTPCCVFICTD